MARVVVDVMLKPGFFDHVQKMSLLLKQKLALPLPAGKKIWDFVDGAINSLVSKGLESFDLADQIKIQDDKIVMPGATKASLEGMPEYQYTKA